MVDGPGHIQPKLHGQIMSKQALIRATWAVSAPPGRTGGCPGHRGPGLNFPALGVSPLVVDAFAGFSWVASLPPEEGGLRAAGLTCLA